jgi:hypothetical protein
MQTNHVDIDLMSALFKQHCCAMTKKHDLIAYNRTIKIVDIDIPDFRHRREHEKQQSKTVLQTKSKKARKLEYFFYSWPLQKIEHNCQSRFIQFLIHKNIHRGQ